MPTGQDAFWVAADVAALDVLETRLLVQEAARGAGHEAQLRTVLELDALYSGRGLGISTVPHLALLLGCSEHRAAALLVDAQGLAELPGALEAVACGLLTVEQSGVVVKQLAVLTLPGRLAVWRRLQARLVAEADAGSVLPPARLSELLRRWVVEADPADAVERRRRAEDGRSVDYRLRPDGLGDLFASGFRATDLHAVLSRIAARSAAWGADDERTADQRRFDAVRDLLLGRDVLAPDAVADDHHRGCGCRSGQPVPCGAELLVHVPLGAALGTTDEAAELVGHGSLDPDLLAELLLAAPRLRAVHVGADGVPTSVAEVVERPQRGDPASVRGALLRLASLPPPPARPRHRMDHSPGARELPEPHPAGSPGAYRPPRWLRRLIGVRSPRCEWPGCGARAVRCDAEHDVAWPDGPTCACNLGPCCRRHHRVKQQGWTKSRGVDGVRWTGPTARGWLSRPQHAAPAVPARALPPIAEADPLDELSPLDREQELWDLGLLPPDDAAGLHTPVDRRPAEVDLLGERLLHGDTRWTLDLDDPYRWLEPSGSSWR